MAAIPACPITPPIEADVPSDRNPCATGGPFRRSAAPGRGDRGCQTEGLPAGASYTLDVEVAVAADAPCSLTNTATVRDEAGGTSDSASDPTNITGGDCDDDGGDGGLLSILPVNLNGVLPMFNNISTNNNINSPGASNTGKQKFSLTAP